MAEPSPKDPRIDTFIKGVFGIDRQETVRQNRCVPAPIGCEGVADKFDDATSAKEYTISGLCQKCQDKFFA